MKIEGDTMSIFFDINWLAVIIATIASALVCYLWYGHLFSKRWAAVVEQEPTKTGPLNANNTKIAMIGLTLLQCFLISSLIDYYKGDLGSVILWAFVIWLGIAAPMLASQWLFEKRRLDMTLICAGHQLVSLLIAACILGIWY
jgi:hypothetical protein